MQKGNTALTLAAKDGHGAAVKVLVEAKANVNQATKVGVTAKALIVRQLRFHMIASHARTPV